MSNEPTPMKTVTPTDAHKAFRTSLEGAIRTHGDTLDAVEILAILSNLVGQVIALQDQRCVSPDMAMALVARNIETGNAEVLHGLLHTTAGTA